MASLIRLSEIPLSDTLPVQKYVPKKVQTKCSLYCQALYRAITYPIAPCIALLARRCQATRKDKLEDIQDKPKAPCVRYSIKTLDHKSTLDALLLRGNIMKTVLLSLGPDSNIEELRSEKAFGSFLLSMVKFIKQQLGDVHILIPDHPKTTRSNERRVQEIQSCYDMLINAEHFRPDDVIVYGHGPGALYGAKAASQIQSQYSQSKINVVIDRSSVDLYEGQIKENGNAWSWDKCRRKKGHVRRGTNINIQTGVEALKGTILAIMSKNDTTIPQELSFTKKVKKGSFEERYEVVTMGKNSDGDTHFAAFTEQEANLVGGHIRDCLHLEKPEEVKNWQS
jgi:hypothetical protein